MWPSNLPERLGHCGRGRAEEHWSSARSISKPLATRGRNIPSSTRSLEVEECLRLASPWMLYEAEKIGQCLHTSNYRSQTF